MRYAFADVVFQEVPDEISLLFFICGCPHRCPGCHSASLWNAEQGDSLSLDVYGEWLDRYAGLVTCILFFGGEWWPEQLALLLKTAQGRGFKTCLYTGLERVSPEIQTHLDYLKTGPWNPRLGGLDQPGTNQRFLRLDTGEVLNSRFHR
ncbi:MAG TPA: anaerobic ribonucleoside-triphosphate reductase activating protein [Oligoflexus sp.]|uniref:anaerobic ribonucleoside-triphosphate reductase activating protein n=1 Tax=Oligoflexus sp. TaxID=1971216 RepID=UPI002D7FB342|nr:anaerobic ribonucleoside-triphosphate reductase activating protein [Oligoflexus sp.]HET9239679.1 anaerobic ribonucleoside-triphosphate reductase activating protein [Oligoflexus sp.]